MNAKAKGYVLGAIAAATYGMNPLFALPLYKAGMNPDSVLFFRYFETQRDRSFNPHGAVGFLLFPSVIPKL